MKVQTAVVGFIVALGLGFAAGLFVSWPDSEPDTASKQLFRPVRGSQVPLVRIVEISDFQCPFCEKAAHGDLRKVEDFYRDSVSLTFCNNPLPMHAFAFEAAKAAMAAHLQGEFWAMHDLLFRNYKVLNHDMVVGFARKLGLDVDRFLWDLDDQRIEQHVRADQEAARTIGVSGTPTFIINGRILKGAQPFDEFRTVIDEEIARAEELMKEQGVAREEVADVLTRENLGEATIPALRDNFEKYFMSSGDDTAEAKKKGS